MSTIAQEPTYGAPQSPAGVELTGGAQAPLDPNAEYNRQMAEYHAKMAAYNAQMGIQSEAPVAQQAPVVQQQAPIAQQPAPIAQQAPVAQQPAQMAQPAPEAQQMPQLGNVNPTVNMPGQMPAQELPSIPDNNPVAELPQNYQAQVAGTMPGGAPQYGMPQQQAPVQQYQDPAQQYAQPQYQAPAQQAPVQQQYQAPAQQYQAPAQQYAQPQYQQPMPGQQQYAQPQYQQPVPGSTAPGYGAGSYIPGGMFGPTPTGHPEKQKFQGQAILVFVKNRLTKKNTTITTGLLNPNMADRNGKAANFVCFSGSAAKQIDIIENPQVRPQYTNIEKAAGQIIAFEGSWEWNDKGKEAGFQLMMDNFTFVNDPNLRQHAETYVPPVPPSPMDMLNGGMMNGGMMQQQYPGMPAQGQPYPGGMPAQPQYQAPGMPAQPYPGGMPAAPAQPQYNPQTPMGGQYNPHQGMPAQPYPGGMPGMPAQH